MSVVSGITSGDNVRRFPQYCASDNQVPSMVSGVVTALLLIVATIFQGEAVQFDECTEWTIERAFVSLDPRHRMGTLPPDEETWTTGARKHRLGFVRAHLRLHSLDRHRNCVSAKRLLHGNKR